MKELIPNFTQIPNIFLDEIMQELNEGELRIMLYIMRRTYGFRKSKDRIAISQFVDGITNKDGELLDQGCGLARQAVIRNIKNLVERNLLLKTESSKGNSYEINTKWYPNHTSLQSQSGMIETQSGIPIIPKVVSQTHLQKKEKESKQNIVSSTSFSLQEKIKSLLASGDKINLIAYDYILHKNLTITSKEEWKKHQYTIFSNAGILAKKNYSEKEIKAMFNYADENYKTWTLNAIAKNCQEILKQLTK